MARDPILRVSSISKSFPGVRALNSVEFDVAAGEVHGLVGENGAGKSTLMAIASGALAADAGTVVVNGTTIHASPDFVRECGLAIVRQEPALMPDLTVAENLYLGMPESKRPPLAKLNEWADNILRRWNSNSSIDVSRPVDRMNSEQRFTIEIARALAIEPRVLILDEPTEHLQGDDIQRLFDHIRALTAMGAGVVYISHRIREVTTIADRITILRDGRAQGTFASNELSEHQIVELIIGKSADHEFPARPVPSATPQLLLSVKEFSGDGFNNVSLDVFAGQIVGLAGMDGNGKREFMRALAGLSSSAGDVFVRGERIAITGSDGAVAAGLQYLSGARHREGMFADLTVRENFSFRSLEKDSIAGFVNRISERRRSTNAIEQFAVKTPSIETLIGYLSGGNQQKVLMAGVLGSEPTILLVDEPTQGVDVGARRFIYQILRDFADRGAAILVVSSDAAEIAGISDRVAVFSRGQIVHELQGSAVTENAIINATLTSQSVRSAASRTGHAWNQVLDWLAGHWAPLVMVSAVVLLLGVYAASVNHFYLTTRNFGGMFTLVAILALVAYAQQALMLIGGIDLSVGPLMGLIVVSQSFFMVAGAPPEQQLIGCLIVIALSVGVGLLNWALVDPIGLHPMVATLATFMAIQATSLILRPTSDGLIDGGVMDLINSRWGFVPVTLIVAVMLAAFLEFALFRSRWGVSVRAFGSRPEAARLSGIEPRAVKMMAYVSCSLIAGLAGMALVGQVGIGDPKTGSSFTLASIAAAVIGGASIFGARGSFVGALLGALLISQVNVVTAFLDLNDAWRSILLGAMIVLSVAFYSKARRLVLAS